MVVEINWTFNVLFCYVVGVGGAVLRDKTNELLIIKERVRNLEFWKVKKNVYNRWWMLKYIYF